MAVGLQPLGFGDRLAAAQELYFRNFWTLVAAVAVVVIPYQLFAAVASSSIEVVDATGEQIDGGGLLALTALIALGFVADMLAAGSATKAIADDYLGNEPNWLESVQYGISRLWPLVVGAVLFTLGFMLGLLFFIIPGIIIAVSWSLWVPAVVVEDKSGAAALGRSNELVKGRRWPVFGYLLVVAVGVGILGGIVDAVVGAILDGILGETLLSLTVTSIIVQLIFTPFVVATYVVLYFDQRVRNEPFDVEQLAANMASEPSHSGFGTLQDDTPPKEFGSLDDESPPESPGPPDA